LVWGLSVFGLFRDAARINSLVPHQVSASSRVLSLQQETLGQLLYLLCFSYLTGRPWGAGMATRSGSVRAPALAPILRGNAGVSIF
jgi:hypothetical protein